MKAVDTNVLIRFLVADDAQQAAKVRALFESAEDDREPLFVSALVILELQWVLTAVYRVPRAAILEALQKLLDLSCLRIEAEVRIRALISTARDRPIDLADLLIGLTALDNHCSSTLTLDRQAARDPLFEHLQ